MLINGLLVLVVASDQLASAGLAALLVQAKELTPLELGTSRDLQPGQRVLAVGKPGGLAGAATAEIAIGTAEDRPESGSQSVLD
tara:strand:+ start:98 stop:349 length:252 start_codon:yes stop_codon:yes gene_type:complete